MTIFDRFERLLEALVEKPFGRIFRAKLHPGDLTKLLLQALEENYMSNGHGGYLLPTYYEVNLSQVDYEEWQTTSGIAALTRDLETTVNTVARGMIHQAKSQAQVMIQAQTDLRPGQVKVMAYHTLASDNAYTAPLESTPDISDTKPLNQLPKPPAKASLR